VGRCLFGLALAAGMAGPSRADSLDEQLNENAPRLVEVLQDRDVKVVGILRFRVKEGGAAETFDAGPLNGNLPQRLENALIVHLGPSAKPAFGVIHDASRSAAAAGIGNWSRDAAQRRKLFEAAEYPLAWGGRKVRADAFLTGKVVLPDEADARAEVVIELIVAANPEARKEVVRFSFAPDLPLLRDLAVAYDLTGKARPKAEVFLRGEWQRQRADARRKHETPLAEPPPAPATPATESITVGEVEFKFLRNGKPALIRGDRIECPLKKDDKVAIAIANRSADKQLGVDVRLNGVSLVLQETREPEYARVFVLDPGKPFPILTGFLLDEKGTVAPFGVLVGEEVQRRQEDLGDKAGQIEVTVFERDENPMPLVISRNLRGLRPATESDARTSLAALQERLMAEAALKIQVVEEAGRKRSVVVPDKNRENEIRKGVKSVSFPRSPYPVAYKILKIVPKGAE
jgi:hypothetical protein